MTDPIMAVQTEYGRFYVHPSGYGSVPSITNIKGMKALDALKYSYAKTAAEFAVDNIEAWSQLERDDAVRLIKGAADGNYNDPRRPSNIGNFVHAHIEASVKRIAPLPANVDEAQMGIETEWSASNRTADPKHFRSAARTVFNMVEQFRNFIHDGQLNHDLRFIDAEFSVWSHSYQYAGTADLGMMYDGRLTLADTKTGKRAYPDTALQLAGLAFADVILRPDGTEFTMPRFEDFRILHLRPMSWEFIPVQRVPEAWDAFKALRAVFDWKVNHEAKTLVFTG
jgi:hypothetical protein